ncbi:MAG: hypothetical protein FWF59_08425 [Turicibacter sp.]|nr:hypothetical protein [Turicibacter sp.]
MEAGWKDEAWELGKEIWMYDPDGEHNRLLTPHQKYEYSQLFDLAVKRWEILMDEVGRHKRNRRSA